MHAALERAPAPHWWENVRSVSLGDVLLDTLEQIVKPDFLEMLPRRHRYAFEFRDLTWHVPAVDEVLHRYNAAFCIFELAGFNTAPKVTADFAYVRLHGPGGKYQGSYSEATLRTWVERIKHWQKMLKAIYVYFDNDQSAYAVHNALALKAILRSATASSNKESEKRRAA